MIAFTYNLWSKIALKVLSFGDIEEKPICTALPSKLSFLQFSEKGSILNYTLLCNFKINGTIVDNLLHRRSLCWAKIQKSWEELYENLEFSPNIRIDSIRLSSWFMLAAILPCSKLSGARWLLVRRLECQVVCWKDGCSYWNMNIKLDKGRGLFDCCLAEHGC